MILFTVLFSRKSKHRFQQYLTFERLDDTESCASEMHRIYDDIEMVKVGAFIYDADEDLPSCKRVRAVWTEWILPENLLSEEGGKDVKGETALDS